MRFGRHSGWNRRIGLAAFRGLREASSREGAAKTLQTRLELKPFRACQERACCLNKRPRTSDVRGPSKLRPALCLTDRNLARLDLLRFGKRESQHALFDPRRHF